MKLLKKFNQSRIATYIGTTPKNIFDSKKRNPESYEIFRLGILIYLHNISVDQLDLMIYKLGINQSQQKVREILGYGDRNHRLSKKSINILVKGQHLIDLKFRQKYFRILGAIATLAGITEGNIEEFSTSTEHKDAPIFADDLPSLTNWRGID